MKKSLLSILAISLMMVSCGDTKGENKADANTDANATTETTAVTATECVVSGDVVFVDLDYVMAASKFNATEGAALKKAMNEFDEKLKKAKENNDTKMTNLINERNKLEAEAAKLNEDYAQGLITSLNAQKKQEEIQTKAASWEKKMSDYQDSAVKEENKLVNEEKELNEKYMVLMNQFNKLASMAIDEINADNRYKMIVNAVSVVKADPSLNISDLVLERVDALFEAGALNL